MSKTEEDPRPPCMACDTGKMEYTGCIITTPGGIPIVKCNACGTTAEVTFPFGTKRIINTFSPANESHERLKPLRGQRREIMWLDEGGEPSDEVRALFGAIMDEYEKKNG